MKFFYSKAFIKQIFLATVIFALIVLFSIIFLFFYTNQTSKVLVPNLIGDNMDDVDQIIKKTKLRYEVIDSSFFNPDFEKKSVIEQIPQPSQKVKKK